MPTAEAITDVQSLRERQVYTHFMAKKKRKVLVMMWRNQYLFSFLVGV